MKRKKRVLLFAILLLLLIPIAKFAVSEGFRERTDVGVRDFSVSEDGSAMTLKIAMLYSMGYVRAMEPKQVGDEIRCTFYQTFGGLNFGLGSRDQFEIQLDPSVTRICFNRFQRGWEPVLKKDPASGEWTQVQPSG